jgi:outer membrane immunogenic protein
MYRHLTIAVASFSLTLGLAGASLAADLGTRTPIYTKAPPVVAPAPSWTGFYAGASVGARSVDNDWTTTSVAPAFVVNGTPDSSAIHSFDSTAARVGGYAGYNWQIAPTWLVGVEADVGWANNRNTLTGGIPGTRSGFLPGAIAFNPTADTAFVKETWDGSVRGRLGYLATPSTLLFGTGGLAWQEIEAGVTCVSTPPTSGNFCTTPPPGLHSESVTTTRTGWTVGGGAEQMWGHWVGRIEYRFADFGTGINHTFFGAIPGADDRVTANVKTTTQTVDVGIAYKF